ncbi:hypothetical protein NXX53_17410 [Bacteroides salyersiae]|nr:hypothetical protein [Bacteroides salyersiae]
MIPKRIHLCWLSGDPYPQKIQKCIDSWKVHLPDYEIMLWDLKRFDIAQVPWVEQAFRVKKYAFAADYIRLYALYNYGGIYLDSDVEVLKRLRPVAGSPLLRRCGKRRHDRSRHNRGRKRMRLDKGLSGLL